MFGTGDEGRQRQLQELVDGMPRTPAFVRDRHLEVLASNACAQALSPAYVPGVNLARFTFLQSIPDPDAAAWTEVASNVMSLLRDSLEQHEEDSGFLRLVGELAAQSQLFASLWADSSRPVRHSAQTTFRHVTFGRMSLVYQELHLPNDFESVCVLWRPSDDELSRERFAQLVEAVTDRP